MSTQKFTVDVADGWVQIENSGSPAIIQNGTSAPIKITFTNLTPDGTTPYHTLGAGEYIERLGTDPIYASSDYDGGAVIITV